MNIFQKHFFNKTGLLVFWLFCFIYTSTAQIPYDQGLDFIDSKREVAIERLIKIGTIISPSGKEEVRAEAVASIMYDIGLSFISIDSIFNVVGLIHGQSDSCLVFLSTLDDLASVATLQREHSVILKHSADRVVGPGSNTSSTTIAMLQAAEAIRHLNIRPYYTLVFAAVSQEEQGLVGMKKVYEDWKDRAIGFVDILGDGSSISYGAIGIHWWKVVGKGPAGHTLQGGLPNVNQGLARAVDLIFDVEITEAEKRESTVLNISMIQSGEVFNHKPESGWFSLDIRSLEEENIVFIEDQVRGILFEVGQETGISLTLEPYQIIPGGQIPGALQTSLVRYAQSAVRSLGLDPVMSDRGSSNLNIPLSHKHLAIGLTGDRGGQRGYMNEWADINALIRSAKVVFLISYLMDGQ